jgi:hypothetical protein
MGADPDRPLDMQADFAHLRRWRMLTEKSFARGVLTVVGLAIATLWGWIATTRHYGTPFFHVHIIYYNVSGGSSPARRGKGASDRGLSCGWLA